MNVNLSDLVVIKELAEAGDTAKIVEAVSAIIATEKARVEQSLTEPPAEVPGMREGYKLGMTPTVGSIRSLAFELSNKLRGTEHGNIASHLHDAVCWTLCGPSDTKIDDVRTVLGERVMTGELVEIAALAACKWDGGCPCYTSCHKEGDHFYEMARAVLAAVTPAIEARVTGEIVAWLRGERGEWFGLHPSTQNALADRIERGDYKESQ